MSRNTYALLIKQLPLPFMSFVIGTCTWYLVSQFLPGAKTCTVPIATYGPYHTQTGLSHTEVHISLSGPRKLLRSITERELAFHINTALLSPGKQSVTLSADMLLIPKQILLTHAQPAHVIAEVNDSKNE